MYNKIVKPAYLAAHQMCEIDGCSSKATEVHHKKGRIGKLLNDTDYFLAVCRKDHVFIENNPLWAKQKGYSINRI